MVGGVRLLTPQITTGNVATVSDPYSATLPNNGALNTPGGFYDTVDGSGRPTRYRYVRYNPTAAGTEIVGPVYWKDVTRTVVTATMSEAATTKANSIAGCLLNPSVTPGDWCWIMVDGYLAGVVSAASTAVDDILIGATGFQVTARVAAGTAPTNKPFAIALTAVSSTLCDIWVCAEAF